MNCNTYYLIVGYNYIVSNLVLEQSVVDDLCARFRIGTQLEYKVTEVLGFDIFAGYNSEDVRIAKSIFSQITLDNFTNSEHFSKEEILSTFGTPSNQDLLHSRDIMTKCFKNSVPKPPSKRVVLSDYLSKFKIAECQTHNKRITNIPLLLTTGSKALPSDDSYTSDMPQFLKNLWSSSDIIKFKIDNLTDIIDQAMSSHLPEESKHKWKKESIFKPSLSDSEKRELALRGVGAKPLSGDPGVQKHEMMSKLSFHPSVDTSDIENFIQTNNLKGGFNNLSPHLVNLIEESKRLCTRNNNQLSTKIWKQLIDMKLISFFTQCSEIFTELSYCYKHWTQNDQFMLKQTPSGIKMIIRNSGTHLFVSFAFLKSSTTIIDTED